MDWFPLLWPLSHSLLLPSVIQKSFNWRWKYTGCCIWKQQKLYRVQMFSGTVQNKVGKVGLQVEPLCECQLFITCLLSPIHNQNRKFRGKSEKQALVCLQSMYMWWNQKYISIKPECSYMLYFCFSFTLLDKDSPAPSSHYFSLIRFHPWCWNPVYLEPPSTGHVRTSDHWNIKLKRLLAFWHLLTGLQKLISPRLNSN